MLRRSLAVPLVVVALLAGVLGFVVASKLAPALATTTVGVIELPATPTPSPSPTPDPTSTPRIRVRTGSGGGDSCPAGCSCQHPPNGIIIQCTGG
jgi:hypothetical protein